ncbi:MAG: CHAP domain-containing protein [Alphaproteobacteria bacterium]|jgi:hypothetical protein|nr:CHAP domain-containing protein [Alphaproteobacteria bacterium]
MKRLGRATVLGVVFALTVLVGIGDASAQYCVRYARSLTDFEIRGNAWSWWQEAAGRYERGQLPMEGAVLVFRRGHGGMRLGHVSTVTGIVDERTILVTHSFGGATLWRDVPVIDTSASNDWSEVRVWSGRANVMGSTEFATYGFIYPLPYGTEVGIPSQAAQGPHWTVLESIPLPPRRPDIRLVSASDDRSVELSQRPSWDEAESFGHDADGVRIGFSVGSAGPGDG